MARIFKGLVDDTVYKAIESVVKNQNPENSQFVDCVVKYFKNNNFADKFYTTDLLLDQNKLSKDIQPFIDKAESSCTPFVATTLGIILMIGIGMIIVFFTIYCYCRYRK